MSSIDKKDLIALLEHNLYYLARHADYAKQKGLYIADTRINTLNESE